MVRMSDYAKLTDDEKIEKFLQAIQAAFSGMGDTKYWPANPPQIEVYFDDILAISIFEKFKEDRGKFERALGRVEPEILKTILYSGGGITGLKVARRKYEGYKLSTEELKDFIVCILDSIAARRRGDEFCLEGKNLVWGPKEAEEVVKETSWESAKSLGLKRAIAGLNVTAESLTWALFFDIYRSAGMRIHGPYQIQEGILLCRDFCNLNPPVWNLQNRYPELKAYLIYERDVKINIDFVNHPIYKTPIADRLKSYSIISKSPLKTLKEIEELKEYYSQLRQRQAVHIEALNPLEIVRKGAEIHYFMLKDFFKFYGEDWRPPKEVYERIDRMGLKYWKRYKYSKRPQHPQEEKGLWAKRTYDPRRVDVS